MACILHIHLAVVLCLAHHTPHTHPQPLHTHHAHTYYHTPHTCTHATHTATHYMLRTHARTTHTLRAHTHAHAPRTHCPRTHLFATAARHTPLRYHRHTTHTRHRTRTPACTAAGRCHVGLTTAGRSRDGAARHQVSPHSTPRHYFMHFTTFHTAHGDVAGGPRCETSHYTQSKPLRLGRCRRPATPTAMPAVCLGAPELPATSLPPLLLLDCVKDAALASAFNISRSTFAWYSLPGRSPSLCTSYLFLAVSSLTCALLTPLWTWSGL